MPSIKFEVGASGVATILLDTGFDVSLQRGLSEAIERIAADSSIPGGVLHLIGKTGANLVPELAPIMSTFGRETLPESLHRYSSLSGVLRSLELCGKPIVCAMEGMVTGLSFELALACHYRIAPSGAETLVGFPAIKFGVLPSAGGTQRLPRLIGIPTALPLLLDGTLLPASKAVEVRLIDAVVEAANLWANAESWILKHPKATAAWDVKGFTIPGGVGCLASHATESFQAGTSRLVRATNRNLPAPVTLLSMVFEGTQLPFDTALRIESKYNARLAINPVARNLIRTGHINKIAADALVRRPAGVTPKTARRLGILGAGMMGAGIAYAAAAAHIQVILIDITDEAAARGKAYSENVLSKDVAKQRKTSEEMRSLLARIEPTTDFNKLRDCDLVIEAVFESRDVKIQAISKAAEVIGKEALFASNTSTLPISGLAQSISRPERFIGLHFFSPVERMPLVEVILGSQTSDSTLAHALDLVKQLRKTPIVVRDSPGFFTSRVFGTFVDEGMAMLAEGIAAPLIENAARFAGMPVGPLAILDEVTLELQLRVHEQATRDKLPDGFRRLAGIDVVKKMVMEEKRIGRRGGGGFYDYPPQGKKRLWQGLSKLFPPKAVQPDVKQLKMRFLNIQALESVRCLEEGVLTHAEDADLGSTLGIGFPSWTGGVISYVDTVGVREFVEQCEGLSGLLGPRFKPSGKLIERARSNTTFYSGGT